MLPHAICHYILTIWGVHAAMQACMCHADTSCVQDVVLAKDLSEHEVHHAALEVFRPGFVRTLIRAASAAVKPETQLPGGQNRFYHAS